MSNLTRGAFNCGIYSKLITSCSEKCFSIVSPFGSAPDLSGEREILRSPSPHGAINVDMRRRHVARYVLQVAKRDLRLALQCRRQFMHESAIHGASQFMQQKCNSWRKPIHSHKGETSLLLLNIDKINVYFSATSRVRARF